MPIYEMHCQKAECQHSETSLMKYEEMKAGVKCSKCQGDMRNKICASMLKGTSNSKWIMAPPVGPNDKRSKAYEKKMDDEHSKFYKPESTFGTGGTKGFKDRQRKTREAEAGKQNFTKD